MLYLPQEYNTYVSIPFIVGVSVLYLIICFFGRKTMLTKQPVSLGVFPIFYNLFQVILSLYMVHGIFGPKGLKNSLYFGINDEHTPHLEFMVWVHYWSKMVDFIDTIVILLKKNERQFTPLHIYHHSTIVVIWGLLLCYNVGNGTTAYGAGLNSLIHSIMYSHYLITSLGKTNPFKKYLTKAQLVQFVMCVLHSVFVGIFEKSDVQPWWVLQFFYQLSMIYLFSGFYESTYDKKEAREGDKKEHNGDNGHLKK